MVRKQHEDLNKFSQFKQHLLHSNNRLENNKQNMKIINSNLDATQIID